MREEHDSSGSSVTVFSIRKTTMNGPLLFYQGAFPLGAFPGT
ncbi:hypothetical protein B4113_3665 [Geobacillus sp. B4113_201601]|nr:hypothetical protein B4113_3665 [Geobacillus sp. B4113_201601]